jgi:hypothetical protein
VCLVRTTPERERENFEAEGVSCGTRPYLTLLHHDVGDGVCLCRLRRVDRVERDSIVGRDRDRG